LENLWGTVQKATTQKATTFFSQKGEEYEECCEETFKGQKFTEKCH